MCVWGDPNVTRPIALNGHTFEVTTNLEAAIRHLRFQDRNRVFWIDAISVNQIDNDERNSQVLLMRGIYTHCERCRAWTAQECVLPEQVMFTCGHKVFDTPTLILASNHWYSHSTSCCYIALLGLPSPDILDNFLDTSPVSGKDP
jgi:hypothetical protein